MKVFAVNSSARTGDVSKTEIMLDKLVQGMQEEGADVEVINLRKKKSDTVSVVFPAGQKPRENASTKMT